MVSIPELALQYIDKSIVENDHVTKTVFMVGSKSVGKTTFINLALGKNKNIEETLVLEYSSHKITQKQGMDKNILHLWEYGGKLETLKNVLSLIPMGNLVYFVIMVDMSKIKSIWRTLETCIKAITEHHTESNNASQLILVCGKYDLFKNFDSEIKKHICITLRSLALLYNTDLIFYSHSEPQLVKQAKEMFHDIESGNRVTFKEKCTNFTKPLLIQKGTDSWDSLGIPEATFEQVKHRHISQIASDIDQPSDVGNIMNSQISYPEPVIDSLVRIKYEEIRNLETNDMSINEYLNYFNYVD